MVLEGVSGISPCRPDSPATQLMNPRGVGNTHVFTFLGECHIVTPPAQSLLHLYRGIVRRLRFAAGRLVYQ